MSGTVNISRDLWNDDAFRDDEFSQREAWVWMIAEASWKPRTRRIGSQVINLDRGQLAGSIRFFAERWKWTPARVFRYFEMLENRNMIKRSAGTAATVITICKYDEYQNKGLSAETPPEHLPEQPRNTSETNEKKEERKGKEEGGGGSAQAREAEPKIDPPSDPSADPLAEPVAVSPTRREELLAAMGVQPSGVVSPSRMIGGQADMHVAETWSDMGLTHEEQCGVIREVMAPDPDNLPSTFKYFTKAMGRLAAQKRAPPPEIPAPIALQAPTEVPHAAHRALRPGRPLAALIAAAAAGTTSPDRTAG